MAVVEDKMVRANMRLREQTNEARRRLLGGHTKANFVVWLYCDGKKFKILECYQCESLSNQTEPLCDEDAWQSNTPSEKDQFVTVCPERQSAFCVKLVVRYGDLVKTTRGCYTDKDSKGVPLSVGCSQSIAEGDGGIVCMCNSNLCNGAVRAILGPVHVASLVLVLLDLK